MPNNRSCAHSDADLFQRFGDHSMEWTPADEHELPNAIKRLEIKLEATQKALRTYAGHHSSCQQCFAIWRELAPLVGDAPTTDVKGK